MRLSENVHLPFDKLMALSKAEGHFGRPSDKLTIDAGPCRSIEGLRYPHPSSLRRTSMYASFVGISEALHLDIFHQPLRSRFFDSLKVEEDRMFTELCYFIAFSYLSPQ